MLKIWVLSVLLPVLSFAGDRPSLQQYTQSLKSTDEIRTLFKDSQNLEKDPSARLQPILKGNEASFKQLLKDFQGSKSFVRGEIEDEKVLSGLMSWLQLALLKARADSFQNRWGEVQANLASWFLFAADFPYEESSLVGLRTVGVVRALLLDEVEKLQGKFSAEIARNSDFRKWFLQIRAPWPVDRVMISEAKRLLKPPMMPVANAAAKAFQKNPYQTSEQALAKVKGGQSESAQLLKLIWREADIQMMKAEINRIGKMKLRLAKTEYEQQTKKAANNAQELVQAGLLDKVPTDYLTGLPLDLTSL
ncbi:MAG: hypothetical protein ACXWC9_05690 [Pseudobdellovibrionaceae bacterium]